MDIAKRLDKIVELHADRDGPLLPILNDVQKEFGCIDDEAKRHLAAALNLTRAEVYGVVSFYHDYKSEPTKLPVLKLCGAEACQARGYHTLESEISKIAEGKCEIETVYCLGLCSVGPNAMIGDHVHARLDVKKLACLIEAL